MEKEKKVELDFGPLDQDRRFLFEEIDSKDIVQYKFGKTLSFDIASISLDQDSFQERFFSKDLNFVYFPLINTELLFQLSVKSDISFSSNWQIFSDSILVAENPIEIKKGNSLFRVRVKLPSAISVISSTLSSFDSFNKFTISLKCTANFSYDKKVILAEDAGYSQLYLQSVELNPRDLVFLEDLSSVFFNSTKKRKLIEFQKPLKFKKLVFARGEPEVIFYSLRGSR